jgi:CubicO group peptidase (beta-lactamase class C family)
MTLFKLPQPGEPWPTITAREAGIDADDLLVTTEFVRAHNSTGFIIAHAGGIVTSHHWHCERGYGDSLILAPKFTADDRSLEDVASAQKSVVSVLTGIALGKGLLSLNDTVSSHMGAGWSRASEADEAIITLRHLLTMTSGLNHAGRVEAEPGSKWFYNLGSTWHTLKRVLAGAAGESLNEILHQWLAGPLGMTESRFVDRPVNTAVPVELRGATEYPDGVPVEGFVSSALDMTRFGLLVCAGGKVDGFDAGLAPGYLAASLQPSTTLNPSYGYLWWLNGQAFSLSAGTGERTEGPMLPSAPKDTVSALGALGRAIYIMPSRQLVIVRLGGSPGENITAASSFGRELFNHLRLE